MIALVVPEILAAAELAELQLDITEAEILEDLSWPGPNPGASPARSEATPAAQEPLAAG